MNINSNWKKVTRPQLSQVAPPSPGTASRLEKAEGETAGDLYSSARDHSRSAENRAVNCCTLGLGTVVAAGGAAALLARNGLPVMAGAAGVLGGALVLTAGYFATTASAEANAWNRFGGELETWARQAQEQLITPGPLPGTQENHNFWEAGSFKSLSDVRRNNQVVARDAQLECGLQLHEDVATQTVTAQSVAGTQTFPRATLELPKGEGDLLRLKTWSDDGTPVVQSFNQYGSSKVQFGDLDSEVQVFPATLLDGRKGEELPDRTLRFELESFGRSYGRETFDVFYAHPPLAGCDFSPNFPTFSAPTTRAEGHGTATSRILPETEVGRLETHEEGFEDALQSLQMSLPNGLQLVQDVATGQVQVSRGGETLRTYPGKLDLFAGTLTEKQGRVDVCQDLTVYPQVAIKTGSHAIHVDADDNVHATRAHRPVPSRLLEGNILEVGAPDLTERLEIPVPRRY